MSYRHPVIAVLALLLHNGCLQGSSSELGLPCSLGIDAGSSLAAYNPQSPECSTGLCLKPMLGGVKDYETAPYCTTSCSSDSDCHGQKRNGEDPDDRRCVRGFACGVAFVVGPLCCQKMCICKDFLAESGVTIPASCQPGTDGRTACEDR